MAVNGPEGDDSLRKIVDFEKIPTDTPLIKGISDQFRAQGVTVEDFKNAATGQVGSIGMTGLDFEPLPEGQKRGPVTKTAHRQAQLLSPQEYQTLEQAVRNFNTHSAVSGGEINLAGVDSPDVFARTVDPAFPELSTAQGENVQRFLTSREFKNNDSLSKEARAKIQNLTRGKFGKEILTETAEKVAPDTIHANRQHIDYLIADNLGRNLEPGDARPQMDPDGTDVDFEKRSVQKKVEKLRAELMAEMGESRDCRKSLHYKSLRRLKMPLPPSEDCT